MTPEQALSKIKKCLAISKSANPHEAAAGLRQAQKLMEVFNINSHDISMADVRECGMRARSVSLSAWEVALSHMVAKAFCCAVFTETHADLTNRGRIAKRRKYIFVGIDQAGAVASYAYDVLSRQCAKARQEHIAMQPKNCKTITKTTRGDAFASGWVLAVESLLDRVAHPEKDKALVQTYMLEKYSDIKTVDARDNLKNRSVDEKHYRYGYAAGAKATLLNGVPTEKAQGLLT